MFAVSKKNIHLCTAQTENESRDEFGRMAEWSNAAVLKTVDLHGSGGSNPSSSAKNSTHFGCCFCYRRGIRFPHFSLLRKRAHSIRLAACPAALVRILTSPQYAVPARNLLRKYAHYRSLGHGSSVQLESYDSCQFV